MAGAHTPPVGPSTVKHVWRPPMVPLVRCYTPDSPGVKP
jgi:hypothetical protein